MNKYLSILVALMVTMFAANSFAFTPPTAPEKGWYVSDGTGQLTAVQISALNDKINRISKATNNELGIAFIQSLNGAAIEDASYATFRSWGIGKHGLDNGVLIMLALKEHKSRIETGKGLGGEITDIQAKQILDGLRPQLRTGDFFGAFNNALDGVSGLLDSRANAKFTPAPPPALVQQPSVVPPVDAQPTVQQSSGTGFGTIFFIVLGLGIMVAGGVYFLVIVPNQEREEEERLQREANARQVRADEQERQLRVRAENQRLANERQRLVDERAAARAAAPVSVPAVQHTTHHIPSAVSVRPSVPLIPAYVAPVAPVYVASVAPQPVQDNSLAIAAAAAAAALLEEQREERRAEERREERREEERREARQREADREEERRAEARREEASRQREEDDRRRRDEESAAASAASNSSWGSNDSSSSSGSDSGGGFSGGDSGGGGASSDW